MKQVVVMKLHSADIVIEGKKEKILLPEGCEGILFVFKSKKAAKAFAGKNAPLMEVKIGDR